MRTAAAVGFGLAGCGLLPMTAGPAHAGITVLGHYTFLDGDTASRASYFSSNRIRVSTPDGREVIFDAKANRVTLIDHRRRVYWDGPVARADSIVDITDGSRWDFMLANAPGSVRTEWERAMAFPSDSIQAHSGFRSRMIAGYPCNRWTENAGPFLAIERWTAAGLAPVDTYFEPTKDVVLAAVLDPVARAVMRMFWTSLDSPELCLAATMTFDSGGEAGRFAWSAERVSDGRVPDSAWSAPRDYRRVRLSSEVPADVSQLIGEAPAAGHAMAAGSGAP